MELEGNFDDVDPSDGSDYDHDEDDQPQPPPVTVQITFAMIVKRNLYPKFQEASQEERVDALSKLTHVRLDRESIGTIDNLDCLGPVTNLYLQWNCIEHIENLEVIPKLTFLVLSGNLIRTVENLTCLPNLKLLDLSHNYIEDFEADQFPKSLIILNMELNPCSERTTYKTRLLEVLPQLKTLDGLEITKRDRMLADCYVESESEGSSSDDNSEDVTTQRVHFRDSDDDKQELYSDEDQAPAETEHELQNPSSNDISAEKSHDNPEHITDDIREGVDQSEPVLDEITTDNISASEQPEAVSNDRELVGKNKLPPIRTKHKASSDKTLAGKAKKKKATKNKTENKKLNESEGGAQVEGGATQMQVTDEKEVKQKVINTNSIQKTLDQHNIQGSFKDLSVKLISRSQNRTMKQQGKHEQRMDRLERLRLKLEPVSVREFNSSDLFTQPQQPHTARF